MEKISKLFNTLEHALFEVNEQVIKFSKADKNKLISALERFKVCIDQSELVVEGFAYTYHFMLYKLYHTIQRTKDMNEDSRIKKLNIYTNKRLLNDVRTFASKIFDEFIKGITYFGCSFTLNCQPKPLYHRCSSCGYSIDDCDNIETCYVERLIFNEIYNFHELHFPKTIDDTDFFEQSQDNGHLNFLNNTVKPKYFANFPDIRSIIVTINDNVVDTIPVKVTITKVFHKGTRTVETYTKEYNLTTTGNKLYKEQVFCEKFCNTTTSAKHFKKSQVFYEPPKKWKEQIY